MNAEKKNFYGWILLVAIGIMFLCSSGFILVGASVVNPLMMADSSMNMNATLMGLGFTLFVLCQGIPAPLIGQFITKYGQKKTFMLLMARNYENEIPQKDMSMYWLPMNTPGVKVTPLDKIGQHMINSCEVYLENVVLDESALVGKKGRGFFQLMKNFEVERLMSTAMNVGMAQAAYEEAARYATERVQFGKTIGSFQLTQEKIINMAIKIENMRNMVYHYAWMKQNGMSIATESAMAKYYTSRAAFEVVDDAMQIMGGIGYTNDVRIARLWRDCRLSRIMAGTDEIMVHIAGRALLKEFANK